MGTLLPFYATDDLLPAPLPTPDAIAASQDVLQDYSGRRIVRIGIHFVVKYGVGVSLTEGQNMLFVKRESTIRIPNVYAVYSETHGEERPPTNYIVIENIAGDSLESLWG